MFRYLLASTAVLLAAGPCLAQQRIAARPDYGPSPGTLVALIDMVKVFEAHPHHKQAMERIRDEIMAFDDEIKLERSNIQKLVKEQKEHKVGTRRYKQLDKEIVSRSADLQLRMKLKRKDILEREAKIFFNTHREVLRHLDDLCARNNIQLVLRHDTAKIDPHSRKSVLAGINRGVVLARNKIDVTPHIIARIKQPK